MIDQMLECGTTYVRCNKPKGKHVRMQKLTCLFKPYMCQTSMRGSRGKGPPRSDPSGTPLQPETQLPHPASVHQSDGSRLHPPVGDVMIGA